VKSFAPLSFALLACSCAPDPAPFQLAQPNVAQFADQAYPVLLRDCGFPGCHGAMDRFFRVFGPGRTRLSATADPSDPASAEEIQHSYDRARSMIDPGKPAYSLLLRKPLASDAGGAGHKGDDALGRNVYASTQDPNYQTLRAWVLAQPALPDAGVGGP
jgi:hypothetical protein